MNPHDHEVYVSGCYRCELGRDCPTCEGEGYMLEVYTSPECPHCEGTGDRFGRGRTRPQPDDHVSAAVAEILTELKEA
jgi:RecJ-like exonuclease